jgi:hypothetical protein
MPFRIWMVPQDYEAAQGLARRPKAQKLFDLCTSQIQVCVLTKTKDAHLNSLPFGMRVFGARTLHTLSSRWLQAWLLRRVPYYFCLFIPPYFRSY